MRLMTIAILLACLTACAPAAPDDREASDTSGTGGDRALPGPSEQVGGEGLAAIELCDAKDYRHLVGSNVAATSFPVSSSLRVFSVNDIVTQDYIPQRTNIVHETSGKIVRVYCG